MKSTLDLTPRSVTYPCLKIHKELSGLVVLFVCENCGFVVGTNKDYDLGAYKGSWFEQDFHPYNGKIILEN